MKCVSIIYRKPTDNGLITQFVPIRPIKKSVDDYIQRLQQKQQNQKFFIRSQTHIPRTSVNTAQQYRSSRLSKQNQFSQSLNIKRVRASYENIFKPQLNSQPGQQKKEKRFRSNFVKRINSTNVYSLKGIKMKNTNIFEEQKIKLLSRRVFQVNKTHSKIVSLKKLKLTKNNTVFISIDFILNQHNFWEEQYVEEAAQRNWKLLQQHSNIIWLTKRQNSSKKLQRYANQNGLRLDGVYQILPRKKQKALTLSLSCFEKDFKSQIQLNKKDQFKKQIIFINSLKVQSIKNIDYEQFYNSFPIVKNFRCIVHFIQIDMNDKLRFNSTLKILSKQKLPQPSPINHLFRNFHKNENSGHDHFVQPIDMNSLSYEEEPCIQKQQMMELYQAIKHQFIDYFSVNLKINLNKRLKLDQTQFSLQFIIGDMLRRNFNILYSYKKQCIKIHNKLLSIKLKPQKQRHQNYQNSTDNKFLLRNTLTPLSTRQIKHKNKISFDEKVLEMVNAKLNFQTQNVRHNNFDQIKNKDSDQIKVYYKEPVFLWKK